MQKTSSSRGKKNTEQTSLEQGKSQEAEETLSSNECGQDGGTEPERAKRQTSWTGDQI